ncbi:hypothetical protein WJX84_010209 [Apatococcus fuscideae]|uniref:Creatinase N-terminal domain-containing protein n=1 Tax=Apatococcus fuscideae TaxID=2026836 RepID=A0AAW1SSF7_9CHLO
MPATSLGFGCLRYTTDHKLARLFSGLAVAAPRVLCRAALARRQPVGNKVQRQTLRPRFSPTVVAMATTAAASNGVADPVAALRKVMAQPDKAVQAYIVPSEDPHMSEYPPTCHERRHFISNFTGSAGVAVITIDKAALWTDGRYFLQAEQQLEKGWELMKAGTPGCPEIDEWLVDVLPEGARVGIDPFLHTVAATRSLQQKLAENKRLLVPLLGGNLVDAVWGSAQPAAPTAAMRVHPAEYAGQSVPEKLAELLKHMEGAKADAMLVTAIDEVAWVLNLRGADVDYNPVFVSYLLISPAGTALYVDPQKITPEVGAHLKECSVASKPYEDLLKDVQSLASSKKRLWIDPAKARPACPTACISTCLFLC